MTRSLPPKPSLKHLKLEAKSILKAHSNADASCCAVLKRLHQFTGKPEAEILAAELKLTQVQFALAMDYGFKNWDAMRKYVETVPAELYSQDVIDGLLARPKLLEIKDNPVAKIWEIVRKAMPDYEVVTGEEIEDDETFAEAEDRAWRYAYRPGHGRNLRYQMTTVTMSAVQGRTPPVRLLAPGRVFRPDGEVPTRTKAFHQVDGLAVAPGLTLDDFKQTCEACIRAVLPSCTFSWDETDSTFVIPCFDLGVTWEGHAGHVLGGGMLKPDTLRRKGFDPDEVQGFGWGIGLERLAMLKYGIDDVHALCKPPYVNA